ncbi:MAG: hypothetical protein CV090_12655 [Nitrospira sp. WS238]|nr:hypothetical protein [Nitrospira sp. WS238]
MEARRAWTTGCLLIKETLFHAAKTVIITGQNRNRTSWVLHCWTVISFLNHHIPISILHLNGHFRFYNAVAIFWVEEGPKDVQYGRATSQR